MFVNAESVASAIARRLRLPRGVPGAMDAHQVHLCELLNLGGLGGCEIGTDLTVLSTAARTAAAPELRDF